MSMNEGYRLLYDQPSQYGFMNILIPYLLNFNGPINSFHIFQGILNILTITIVALLSKLILNIKELNLYIFLFSIILLLSSTDLFGPQVYPSTGVIRFFPVYLLILAQCYIRNRNCSRNKEILYLSFCLFISLIWGSEALFYILFSIGLYYLQELLMEPTLIKFKDILYKGSSIILIAFFGALIVVKIYQYNFNIENLNIGLHFSFVTTYGSKAISGQSPNVFTPILIGTIPLLIALVLNKKNKSNFLTIACYGSIIISVLSYSFMRSIANNFNNLWPILFLCFSLIYYEIKKRNKNFNSFSLKIILLPCLIISSLCLTNVIIKYQRIPAILQSQKLKINDGGFVSEFRLDQENDEILKVVQNTDWNTSSLSILTWSGRTGNTFNSSIKPFLPGPAVSLTYHDPEYIKKILHNSDTLNNRNGLLIHDKYWETYKTLAQIVIEIKNCKSIIISDRYDLYECYSDKEGSLR